MTPNLSDSDAETAMTAETRTRAVRSSRFPRSTLSASTNSPRRRPGPARRPSRHAQQVRRRHARAQARHPRGFQLFRPCLSRHSDRLTAALLSVDPLGWCLLVIAAGFVLVSELIHSAIDTLACAVGDPDDPPLAMAREIAAAAVVVASFISGGLTVTVLLVKLGALFSWW